MLGDTRGRPEGKEGELNSVTFNGTNSYLLKAEEVLIKVLILHAAA